MGFDSVVIAFIGIGPPTMVGNNRGGRRSANPSDFISGGSRQASGFTVTGMLFRRFFERQRPEVDRRRSDPWEGPPFWAEIEQVPEIARSLVNYPSFQGYEP